jgi:O-antigen/teichoic acid export membrane protein
MFSWSIFVVQVATVIVYQQTDRLVIGIFLGAAAVTLYEAAGKFQGFIVQLIGFATSAVLPMASKLDAEGRKSALHTLYFRGSKYTVALIAPVVVVLLVFAQPLIVRWLGPAFAGQAIAAQIMVLPQLFMCTATLGDSIIIAQGKLPERLPYVIAVTVANLVLSLALVRPLGILGVVLGTTIPYIVDYPFHVRLQIRQVGVSFKDWLRNIVTPTYPLLLVPLLIAWLFTYTPLMSRVAGVGLAGAVAVFAYWLALYFLGLSGSERDEVRAAVSVVRKRLGRGSAE